MCFMYTTEQGMDVEMVSGMLMGVILKQFAHLGGYL